MSENLLRRAPESAMSAANRGTPAPMASRTAKGAKATPVSAESGALEGVDALSSDPFAASGGVNGSLLDRRREERVPAC